MKHLFDIVGKKKWWFAFSGTLVLASVIVLAMWGLKPGIDFTGGTLLEISFTGGARPTQQEVATALEPVNLGPIVTQVAGEHEMILRFRYIDEKEHETLLQTLRATFEKGDTKVLQNRLDTVGASFSEQLKTRAGKAIFGVIILMISFIAYSFRKVSRPVASWKFGVAAILALVHDLIITMGVFAVLGHVYHVEVDIPFVVALLTIFGYSMNDTIVVFDRIRERLLRFGGDDFSVIVNQAVNETVMRSINTSLTVLLVLSALFFFGGASIHYFALALIIGIFFGTYSSIFIASPILVTWHEWSENRKS